MKSETTIIYEFPFVVLTDEQIQAVKAVRGVFEVHNTPEYDDTARVYADRPAKRAIIRALRQSGAEQRIPA